MAPLFHRAAIIKHRKGTSMDDSDSTGVSIMPISTVDHEIQRGLGRCDEEEQYFWGYV